MVVNDRREHIGVGDNFIKSPLIIVQCMSCSEDFTMVCIFKDEIEKFAPIATAHFNVLKNVLNHRKYVQTLSKQEQDFLLGRKALIDGHKEELEAANDAPKQQSIIAGIILLLEHTTLLEYVNMVFKHDKSFAVEPEEAGENSTMIKFIFLLFRNYGQHRDVGFYADALHLSKGHFSRIIKKTSFRTPSEWISLVTINHAKKLLREGSLSIKQVAERLSFPEQFTFRKYFKQHCGISPKEFRRNCALKP